MKQSAKEKMIEMLTDFLVNAMFGDGMERDYILNGMTYTGLNKMTDEQLIQEFEMMFGDEYKDLVMEFKGQISIPKVLEVPSLEDRAKSIKVNKDNLPPALRNLVQD